MQNAFVNVNGEICSGTDAKISVFDRGFLYGDSLYEVIRTYNGQFAFMKEHLERLVRSAELAQMVIAQTPDFLEKEMTRTLRAFQARPEGRAEVPTLASQVQWRTEAYCRLIVTRGVGKIGFGLSALLTPSQVVIIVQPLEPPTDAELAAGLHLGIVERLRNDPRALSPAMKSGNYLNNLLAFLEAERAGFNDALLCNADGHLTEGTTFNLFYVHGGVVTTPPLEIGILEGITRKTVLRLAKEANIPVREVRFPKERLYEADEVFITSTIKEVFPVTRIDHRVIGSGKMGPVTAKLRGIFARYAQKSLSKELN